MAEKRGRGKNVAGQIVNFLREKAGSAAISTNSKSYLTQLFNCSGPSICYSLRRLVNLGIIFLKGKEVTVEGRLVRVFTLAPEFIESESWQEKISIRKSASRKPETTPESTETLPNPRSNVENIGTKLLEQVIITYQEKERLKEIVRILRAENSSLLNDKKVLADQLAEAKDELRNARSSMTNDANSIAALELRLREALDRSPKTKHIRFDSSGVQI